MKFHFFQILEYCGTLLTYGLLNQVIGGPTVSNARNFGLGHEKNFVDGTGKNLAGENGNDLEFVSEGGDRFFRVTDGGSTMNTFGSVLRSEKKIFFREIKSCYYL